MVPIQMLITPVRQVALMAQVTLDDGTVARLDELKIEDESYDELVNELINIYEATEMTLAHGGDDYL